MDLQTLFNTLDWRAGLDILLVTVLVYHLLAMLKGTRAAQILIGLVIIFVLYALSSLLQLETINWIVSRVYSSIIIVLIVLFQDDIRRLLTRMGSGPFTSRLESESGLRVIEEVISAAKGLSHDRLGAIVVFERGVNLERLHDYGIRVDSVVSEEILICIFQSFSPLHDGAVIIRNNRLSAASTQLPLSKNPDLTKKLGTRHSASLGISEETDAVAVVISEETGHISIACDGELYRQASPEAARRMLIQLLLPSQKTTRWKILLRKLSRSRGTWPRRKTVSARSGSRTVEGSTAEHDVTVRAGAVARENDVLGASTESLVVRVPLKGGGLDLHQFDSQGVVVSDKRFSVPTGEAAVLADDSVVSSSVDEGREQEDIYKQNQAIRSLSQMGPEDKFIPPSVVPSAPPRDVSIGGVSLNPPIDTTSLEDKDDTKEDERDDK